MIITVASFKGGVAKTTTAVHLAAYLQRLAPTLLLDGDPNRQALVWDAAGRMPFKVADILQSAKHAADYGVGRGHIVIDTEARPGADDFKALAEGCDLLVIPAAPDPLDTYALMLTLKELRKVGTVNLRVLVVKVPTGEKEAEELRAQLISAAVPVFTAEIPILKAFKRAVAQGVPVYAVKGDPYAERAWKAYEAAGREIIQ